MGSKTAISVASIAMILSDRADTISLSSENHKEACLSKTISDFMFSQVLGVWLRPVRASS